MPVGFARWRWLVAGIGALICIAGAVVALVSQEPSPGPMRAPLPRTVEDLDAVPLPVPSELVLRGGAGADYAGSDACSGCHPAASRDHAASGHARAIRPVSLQKDGPLFSQRAAFTDESLGLTHSPAVRDGKPIIRSAGFGVDMETEPHLVIGSGTHGQTYLHLRPDGTGLVPRISLYRRKARLRWDWTPGTTAGQPTDEPTGQSLPPEGASQCVGCHSTVVHQPLDRQRVHLGVGCERCHGPAKKHIAAITGAGAGADRPVPRLQTLAGAQVLALCNTCHRPLERKGRDGLPADLARAQPLALAMSRCFQASGGRVSCVTCHDPHGPVVRERRHYERACVSCHAQGQSTVRLCSVNRSSGCVNCHMSRERMRQFNDTVFTHHWIRRRPERGERKVRVGAAARKEGG